MRLLPYETIRLTTIILSICFQISWCQVNVDSLVSVVKKQPSNTAQISYLDSILRDLSEKRIPGGIELFQYRKQWRFKLVTEVMK